MLGFSCNDDDPVGPDKAFTLRAEDVGVTEVWLKLTVNVNRGTFALKRNDSTIISTLHSPIDTLLLDEGLLPKQTYTYKAGNGETLTVTTMDTTSHDFTWQIDTLGDGNGSVLYDVAIINDTLAYAVGEIYKKDSTGQFETDAYNAARWDGNNWNLERIPYKAFPNATQRFPGGLRAIYAFGLNQIIVTQGSMVRWYDGVRWSEEEFLFNHFTDTVGGIRKFWGTSKSNLYGVGDKGAIWYYNGSVWKRVESGTGLPIRDIFGARDKLREDNEILCIAEGYGTPGGSKVLSIEGTNVHELTMNGLLSWSLWDIWFVPKRKYIAVGDGLWQARSLNGVWSRNSDLPALFKTSIHGKGLNDIAVCGAYWLLAHYNGVNWRTYFPFTSGSLTSIKINNNKIIAVGGNSIKAFAINGLR